MKHINALNTERDNCCGCSACQQVCPHNCILMKADEEGFLYPEVNEERCVDCGLCSSVCSWIGQDKDEIRISLPEVYATKHKDNEVRHKSTSGGMFTAFASYVLKNGGVVYGASFLSATQKVGHIGVSAIDDLSRIQGSKYVQSNQGNVFREIRNHLNNGILVLYTGTPCQCAGLRHFLRKNYENLFIIDILCHSVPSPRVFDDLLRSLGGKFEEISFRNKDRGWRDSYMFQLFKNGETLFNKTYLTMFFKGLINRPSCYHCKFTKTERSGDLTIGDYWNINVVHPEFEDSLGVSCLLVNTEKGKRLFNEVRCSLDCLKTELAPALQTCMMRNVAEPKMRKKFWADYMKYGFSYCEVKYGRMTRWEKLRDRALAPFARKIGIAGLLRKMR